MSDIIFLPGLACNEKAYSHQINALIDQHNCNVILCNKFDNMEDHVRYVVKQISEKAVIVGHSYGGQIAQWVAINHPNKVSSLVLISTYTGNLTIELESIFKEMLREVESDRASQIFEDTYHHSIYKKQINNIELYNTIRGMEKSFSKEELINQLKTDLEGLNATSRLVEISCPTLLINGKYDSYYEVYSHEMKVLSEKIKDSYYIEIDNCGHMVPMEHPEAVTALLEIWLKMQQK